MMIDSSKNNGIVKQSIIQIGPYPINPQVTRGGVEASVFGLTQELSKKYNLFVLDIPRIGVLDSIEKYEHITVYRFSNPGKNQKDCSKRIRDLIYIIKSICPTVCHIHGTGPFSLMIYKEIVRLAIPIVITVHGLLTIEKKNALKERFTLKRIFQYFTQSHSEKHLLSIVKEVIVDTEYVEEQINKYTLRRKPRSIVIPQGINNKYFELEGSQSSKMVLSVGSISRRKGHVLLVKAFDIAARELQDIQLVICGVLSDNDYYQELVDVISTLQSRDRISLRTNVALSDLLVLYTKAHAFALHSQEESQGIAFAEAMAAGLPVIATNVGGIPYVVKDKETGLLTDYGDITSFAESIRTVMSTEFDWFSIHNKCIITALHYNWETISTRISQIYEDL